MGRKGEGVKGQGRLDQMKGTYPFMEGKKSGKSGRFLEDV